MCVVAGGIDNGIATRQDMVARAALVIGDVGVLQGVDLLDASSTCVATMVAIGTASIVTAATATADPEVDETEVKEPAKKKRKRK